DSTFTLKRDRDHARGGISHNARVGADLIFDKKNTLTLSGNFNHGNERNTSTVEYRELNSNDKVTSTIIRDQLEKELDQNVEGNIRYEKSFEKEDHKWITDMKYTLDKDHERADIDESVKGESRGIDQKSDNVEDEENYMFKSDYIHPFGNEGKFETGIKSTNRFIDNIYKVEQKDKND
ncbi:MAG: outer membrane beta-barrel protein, partial [Flavobacteriales bacterium]